MCVSVTQGINKQEHEHEESNPYRLTMILGTRKLLRDQGMCVVYNI